MGRPPRIGPRVAREIGPARQCLVQRGGRSRWPAAQDRGYSGPMDFGLAGRPAVVTGGSRGIGRAIAIALAPGGCNRRGGDLSVVGPAYPRAPSHASATDGRMRRMRAPQVSLGIPCWIHRSTVET